MTSHVRAAGVATTLLIVLLAGCAGEKDDVASSDVEAVAIEGFAFDPADLTVDAGTELQVVNRDSAAHTLTAKDGSFDTGKLGADETGKVVLEKAGEYEFFCEIHQYMRGTITVR